jgi:D-lactate dehydrogenase (cytochrome)
MKHAEDEDAKSQFMRDESNAIHAEPDSVSGIWFPESEADMIEVLELARNLGQAITISGAGTGLTGARVPVHGGIVMSMENMIKVGNSSSGQVLERQGLPGLVRIAMHPESSKATVPPGISLSELDSTLSGNWMYPPDPTERLASIGGTVSTNASGARCFHYGPTRNWIDGLRVVLADGDILNLRRGETFADETGTLSFASESGQQFKIRIPDYRMPDVKNAAGLYSKDGMDLVDLFVGSEGILGIVSEIRVKLMPADPNIASDLAFFGCPENALDMVDTLRNEKDQGILALEYFDGRALDFIRDQYPDIPKEAGAAVLVELREREKKNLAGLYQRLQSHGCIEDWCANNSADLKRMKEFRHALPESINTYLRRHESQKLGTDLAVPLSRFREMMGLYQKAEADFETQFPRDGPHCVTYGHVGDCHAHFNFITLDESERNFAKRQYARLASIAVGMGGTVSAEHGAGKRTLNIDGTAIPYLQLMYGEHGLREIARVKKAMDPRGILNPGNMVPAGWL